MMVSSVIHCEIKAARPPERRWREGYEYNEHDISMLSASTMPGFEYGQTTTSTRRFCTKHSIN